MTAAVYCVVIFLMESMGESGMISEIMTVSWTVSMVFLGGVVRRREQNISVSSVFCRADTSIKVCSVIQLGSICFSKLLSMEISMKKKTKPTDTVTENDLIVWFIP